MQAVSSTFHEAVLAGAPQSAYLRFEDDVFTNEDIDISGGGIRWNQAFCNDTDLKIGATMSANFSCELLNENKVLQDYSFGEFHAWLGVRIANIEAAEFTGLATGGTGVTTRSVTIGSSPGWILVDGTALGSQPAFEPVSMAVDGGKVYAIGADGTVWGYDLENGAVMTLDLTDHMEAKAMSFAKRGLFVSCWEFDQVAITHQWTKKSGYRQVFEYCRLGVFTAERPAKLMDATVSITANDRMVLFEGHLGSELTIPSQNGVTFMGLMTAMCNDVGITFVTQSFPNSTLVYKKPKSKFKTSTYREIIGYVAEAAGRVARMTRDGKLEFAWLNSTQLRVTPDKYSEAAVYSYTVKKIGRTQIYSDSGEVRTS